jgi:nucleolar complex protein 3
LTAHEEAEKVRDEVRRLREGEKGLVKSYKLYLKTLETEIKREWLIQIARSQCA